MWPSGTPCGFVHAVTLRPWTREGSKAIARRKRGSSRRQARRSPAVSNSEPLIELEIEELAAGGDGVGHASDGRVVFVPFTAPGDRVRVRITDLRSSYSRGVVEALLGSGPQRVDPVCAVFGSCGGCAWQHVDYAAQLDAKRMIAFAALQRIGGFALPDHIALPITPSRSPYRYRTRSRVVVSAGKVGYRRRRSHAIAATRRCPILAEELEVHLSELADDPPGTDSEWELVTGRSADLDAPVTRALPLPATGGTRLWLPVGEDRIGVSPGVFGQSNAGLLDLREAGIDNVRVLASSVEAALDDLEIARLHPDRVVVDPPRSGLGEAVAEQIAKAEPERIIYLSCDPATLARDLSVFDHHGYQLIDAQCFDLFPQTPHVEMLAVMRRE
ncbi:MAG: class I SAM-dependent RNA methyltransferase [Deltaproteobacteria bacterium]|nr:class I SAM-dependent RNA methyltransferase [Deltaproteobacteria bacterium]